MLLSATDFCWGSLLNLSCLTTELVEDASDRMDRRLSLLGFETRWMVEDRKGTLASLSVRGLNGLIEFVGKEGRGNLLDRVLLKRGIRLGLLLELEFVLLGSDGQDERGWLIQSSSSSENLVEE